LVENGISDGDFFRSLVRIYDHQRLQKALDRGWLRIEGAGGKGEIPRRIKYLGEQNSTFFLKLTYFVLTDSDQVAPYDPEKLETEISKCCKTYQIDYHILYKREIENYLPSETLESNLPEDLMPVFEAFMNLTPDQKDFYDMEKGFSGKGTLASGQEELFDHINSKSERFKALRNGFDRRDFKVKGILYTLFADESVTKPSLDQRCTHQKDPRELEHFLEKLSDKL